MRFSFNEAEISFAEAVVRVTLSNPFLPERIEAEREALGDAFVEAGSDWNTSLLDTNIFHPNIQAILVRCEALVQRALAQWPRDGRIGKREARLYEGVAAFWLFHRNAPRFDAYIQAALEGKTPDGRVDFYPSFKADALRVFEHPGLTVLERHPVTHLFACSFQIRRAFHCIYRSLVGASKPMTQLRAGIWQSIFTHDLQRYREHLYSKMGDFSTLVTGPSGSGKELVARAVALSRYLAFDPKRGAFEGDFSGGFFPLNLAALSPTIIESELFGHRRGAFTGALADRVGWMERCPSFGAVFLDEIGEVEQSIQVKLLRVLQSRGFQALGSTENLRFTGKIIAATNRDLAAEIQAGRFREDFYYRLCSDRLRTPGLREQLDDHPDDLYRMIGYTVRGLLPEDESEAFTMDCVRWIGKNLGDAYAWPGNFRELEQCVRNLLLRGAYSPALTAGAGEAVASWASVSEGGRLSAEEILTRYTRFVHARELSLEGTARVLDQDRRTVKARLT